MAKMFVQAPLRCLALLAAGILAPSLTAAETASAASEPGAAPARPVVQLRWIGKDALARDTNASYFLGLWNLPAGQALETATLSKLAAAPWRLAGKTNDPAATTGAALLQPLLLDLLRSESAFELQAASRHEPSATLAIRLSDQRASLWQTNLAEAIRLRTGKSAAFDDQGWSLARADGMGISLRQTGEWVLVSVGKRDPKLEEGVLDTAKRPLETQGTNRWLQAIVDFAYLAELNHCPVETRDLLPKTTLTLHGEGDYVRTLGMMEFPKPLDLDLQPWTVPTNLIHEPLISFSLLQGFRPWLALTPLAKRIPSDFWPEKLYLWALKTFPVHTFAAVPTTNATELLERRGPFIYSALNSWSTNRGLGDVMFSPAQHALWWEPLPLFTPSIKAVTNVDGEFLVGTMSREMPGRGAPIPAGLVDHVTAATNLLYYDWEITGERLSDLVFLGQSWRMTFRLAQLPPNALTIKYMQDLFPKLGNTVTEVSQTSPNQLSLVRKSHASLTGAEMHLLADWLESPQFPRGLLTVLGPRSEVLRWNKATRSFGPPAKAPAPPSK